MGSGGFELHAEAPADEVGRKAHERHERWLHRLLALTVHLHLPSACQESA